MNSPSQIFLYILGAGLNDNSYNDIFDVNVFKSLELLNNAIKNSQRWLIISTSSEYGLRNKKRFTNSLKILIEFQTQSMV